MPTVGPWKTSLLALMLLLLLEQGGVTLRSVQAQEQGSQNSPQLLIRDSSGSEYPAVLQAFAGKTIRIKRGGVGSDLDITDLNFVRFPDNLPADDQVSTQAYEILLRDGSRCRATSVTSDGDLFQVQTETWILRLEPRDVLSIRFSELTEQQQAAWQAYREGAANSDLLVVKQPTGALTKIEGIVLGVTPTAINFEFGGTQLPVPFERLAGVRFFSSSNTLAGSATGVAHDANGNRWMFTEIKSANASSTQAESSENPENRAEIALQLHCGVSIRLPLQDLVSVDFGLGSKKSLTDLELVRKSAEDAFEFGTAGIDISSLFGVRPIAAGNEGLGSDRLEFLGSGEAVYMVPQEFTRFIGSVELQPRGNRFTSCTVEIFLERERLWSEQLSSPGRPLGFDVPVSPDQRLRLVVRANSSIPTGTVVVWSEPTLTK